MKKRKLEEDFWVLLHELETKFYNRFGCHLYNAREAVKIIDAEYALKRGKNLNELDENGKLSSVSKRTLQYYWRKDEKSQKEKEGKAPNISILDIICICVGYATWDDFCLIVRGNKITKDFLFNPKDFDVEKMKKGETYIIGWFPTYFIKLYYLGNYEFKVMHHSHNLPNKYESGDILTIYGFGLYYLPSFYELSDNNEKYIDGYPLYPKLFFLKEKKTENIDFSSSVYVCSKSHNNEYNEYNE